MTRLQSRCLFWLLSDILTEDANKGHPVVASAMAETSLSIDDLNELADALADSADFDPDEVESIKECFRDVSKGLPVGE